MIHWRELILVLSLALAALCCACSDETEGKQKQGAAAPVEIGPVLRKDVPIPETWKPPPLSP